jgi:hypothetical protein
VVPATRECTGCITARGPRMVGRKRRRSLGGRHFLTESTEIRVNFHLIPPNSSTGDEGALV